MRRLLSVFVVAATTMIVPVIAMAGNQELADQLAYNLRHSGALNSYRIAVKVQDGTATIRGQVASQSQMNSVLKIPYKTPGVLRVVNELTVNKSSAPAKAANNDTLNSAQKFAPSNRQPLVQTASANMIQQQRMAANAPRAMGGPAPLAVAMSQVRPIDNGGGVQGAPRPMYSAASPSGVAPVRYDQACMPNYAWPSYAAYPNYAAVTYPMQYSPTAWPYIGPFYPYPQVPLGWRKVTLEWKDGWWFLDFKDEPASCWRR